MRSHAIDSLRRVVLVIRPQISIHSLSLVQHRKTYQQRASAARSSRVVDTPISSLQHHLHKTELNLSRPPNRKRHTQEPHTTSMETVPLIQCMGCHFDVCNGNCLATHRDRYCCHNPRCIFHAPCPLPAEQGTAHTTSTSSTTEQALVRAATPSADDAEGSPAAASDDSNVIYRETITREWRLVGVAGAPATGQALALPWNTTPVLSLPSTTPAPDAPSSAQVDSSSISPVRFTIEEYEAQARLLAQFQPPQGQEQRRGQRGARTGGDGRGQGARVRPRVRIQFN